MTRNERRPTPSSSAIGEEYVSASEAMSMLGVSAQTLYAYVSRKGIRSRPVPGTRQRRYWRADIERLRQRRKAAVAPDDRSDPARETEITLITDAELFYRGQSAITLADKAPFETVAALLWGVEEQSAFGDTPPQAPAVMSRLYKLLAGESLVNRATALFPLLEEANPRAYDLSHAGMARTGADILRWMAAISLPGVVKPTTEPIHLFLAQRLKLSTVEANLVRRMLVLAADSGFEPGAVAVRALASTGVTPWRAVIAGLSVSMGRKSRLRRFDSIARFVSEISESTDPRAVIVRRVRVDDELPGFSSSIYAHGDPRARALFRFCAEAFASHSSFKRLSEALRAVREIKHLEPNFVLVYIYAAMNLDAAIRESLFHIARTAGWIAHAIEEYQMGEMKRQSAYYKGQLP